MMYAYEVLDLYGDVHLRYGDSDMCVYGVEDDAVKMSMDTVVREARDRGWPVIPDNAICRLEELGIS